MKCLCCGEDAISPSNYCKIHQPKIFVGPKRSFGRIALLHELSGTPALVSLRHPVKWNLTVAATAAETSMMVRYFVEEPFVLISGQDQPRRELIFGPVPLSRQPQVISHSFSLDVSDPTLHPKILKTRVVADMQVVANVDPWLSSSVQSICVVDLVY